MNVAELDRAIDNNRADTPETLNLLYEGMVKAGGIAYFEFPKIREANKVRHELLKLEKEFEEFKENVANKKFPEDTFQSLKNQFIATLKDIANASGKEYRTRATWNPDIEENILHQAIIAMANLAYPEEFLEGVGTPESYIQRYMEYVKKISDFQNSWDLHHKWPVIFSADYIDTWISDFIAGRPTKYWLPRQRFKRLAGGGTTGLWVDRWMSEVLGKEVKIATQGQFLDLHTQWIEEYFAENPL